MWEKGKKSILILLAAVCLLGFLYQKKIMREVSPDEKNELIKYLQLNWETPENYILSKFHDHDSSFYSAWYDKFKLSDFCDGYVFQKHIGDYEGCAVDLLFVTEENLKEAIDYLPNPKLKTVFKSPQQFFVFMRLKVNMKRKFGDFE